MTSDVDDDDLKSNDDDDSWVENELPDDEKDEVDDDTFALHLLAASSVEDNASSNARNSRDEQSPDNVMSQQEKTADPTLSQDGFSFADPSQSSGKNRSVPSLIQDGFAFGNEQSPKALQPRQ